MCVRVCVWGGGGGGGRGKSGLNGGFGVVLTKCFWSRRFMSYFVFFCCLYICKP